MEPILSNIQKTTQQKIWSLLEAVTDPEIPVLSVVDLGIIRDVCLQNETINIVITPTYSGCPAMDVLRMNIRLTMLENGFSNFTITTILSPAWSTDWMTQKGRDALKAYGIAPPMPVQSVCSTELFAAEEAIQCPHCNSYHTRRISEFGSTACKSLYQCNDCQEPFDYFKCH